MWLNKVGTFGVGSAGDWWGRAGACCCRLSRYMLVPRFMLWLKLFGDDEWLVGRGPNYVIALLLHMFFSDIIDTLIAWNTVGGGVQSDCVGYYLDLSRFKARKKRARLGEVREGLGRLQFIARPLGHIRPSLGPLYAWSCAGPRLARPHLPVMILIIIRFLAAEIGRRRDEEEEKEDVPVCSQSVRPGRGVQARR